MLLDGLKKEDVQLLADVGFLALSYGNLDVAEDIFKGIEVVRPNGEAGPLGLALTELARGDVASAVERLKKLPPSDPVQLYLGIALSQSGDLQSAEDVFTDLVATAGNSPVGEIAKSYLDKPATVPPIL